MLVVLSCSVHLQLSIVDVKFQSGVGGNYDMGLSALSQVFQGTALRGYGMAVKIDQPDRF